MDVEGQRQRISSRCLTEHRTGCQAQPHDPEITPEPKPRDRCLTCRATQVPQKTCFKVLCTLLFNNDSFKHNNRTVRGALGQHRLWLQQSKHPKPLAPRLPDLASEHSGPSVKIEFLINTEQLNIFLVLSMFCAIFAVSGHPR